MSSEFEKNLDKFAEVILKITLNLQSGQKLLITSAPLELAPLVRLIVKKAYQIGARLVSVLWDDEQLTLTRFQHAPRDSFNEYPVWRINSILEVINEGGAILSFDNETPDLLMNQDPKLIMTSQQSYFKNIKPVLDKIFKNESNWAVIAAPIDGWAKKLFPKLSHDNRIKKLWDIIFDICRVKYEDPVSIWKQHARQLLERCKYLNKKQYKALKLIAPGTDLKIGLPKGHIWLGGYDYTPNGIKFTANIPTEEVFTMPHKDKTEGVVTATKPLYFDGNQIENFKLKFSKGEVIEVTANKGESFLKELIKTDQGAKRLGEIALVPNSSPVSKSNLVFYNILVDENASNHIALGRAYKNNIKNGQTMSDDGFLTAGGNNSLIHIDFMIGSDKMNVNGILEDGSVEPVMQNGEWAF